MYRRELLAISRVHVGPTAGNAQDEAGVVLAGDRAQDGWCGGKLISRTADYTAT
jgi:hypothetical protein